ncbi:porin family protein [Pontibacter qinzhouensis]|uniref:Porin family protein n=1 Tax=Pontibacter qinzhouensis TaxID=2603253 RepID=A0A5C8KFX3_9BACT|nr:outer membrane beta-barrel protein [Pontibacter qinzhouensis]TXK52664.1 porin family protein [Pontibacter qinzhouensis]
MKKTVLALMLLLIAFYSEAQNREVITVTSNERRVWVGAQIGLNAFTLTEDPNFRDSSLGLGWQLGVFARIGTERFYLQPGVEYMSNTISNVDRALGVNVVATDDIGLRYLRFPVMAGYVVRNAFSRDPHLRLLAGPSLEYNIGVSQNNVAITRRQIRNAQFAINAGLGFDLWILNFDVLYHHNLMTTLNFDNAEGKRRGFSVSTGLRF